MRNKGIFCDGFECAPYRNDRVRMEERKISFDLTARKSCLLACQLKPLVCSLAPSLCLTSGCLHCFSERKHAAKIM